MIGPFKGDPPVSSLRGIIPTLSPGCNIFKLILSLLLPRLGLFHGGKREIRVFLASLEILHKAYIAYG